MLTLSGCKFELDICPAIHLVNRQIFGTIDFALSVIHITGTHTDPAYVIHLKYEYQNISFSLRSGLLLFVIDRLNLAVCTYCLTLLLFCLLESDDIFIKHEQLSYTGYAGLRYFITSHL